MFNLDGEVGRPVMEKIAVIMKPRGYTCMAHNASYHWFSFANEQTGLHAEIKVVTNDQVTVKLWFLTRAFVVVQTPEIAIDHPKFSDLFENRILEIKNIIKNTIGEV